MKTKILLTVIFLLGLSQSFATVLTFDFNPALANGQQFSQDYGDNVTSVPQAGFTYGTAGGFTPNVVVDYFGSVAGVTGQNNLNFWSTGYDDLSNVAYYAPTGDVDFGLTLTAEPGFNVTLSSFDLGYWLSSGTLNELAILDSEGAVLFSQTDVALGGGTAISFTVNLTDDALTIRMSSRGQGSASDNFGIDNIEFSQSPVPEPATYSLLFGLGVMAFLARRRAYSNS
jgi:hypothetical protein